MSHAPGMCDRSEWVLSEWVMSHVCTRQKRVWRDVASLTRSRYVWQERVSPEWLSHVTRMNESCVTLSESCHTYARKMCDMTHSLWSCVTWLTHRRDFIGGHHILHVYESCHTYESDVAHIWISYITHTSYIRQVVQPCRQMRSRVTHMNKLRHKAVAHIWISYVTHTSYVRHVTMWKWVTPHVWISHVTRTDESRHAYEWVKSHICTSHVTRMKETTQKSHVIHINESCHAWMSHATYGNVSWHTYRWGLSHI